MGAHPSRNKKRCSDKGFLAMAEADYLEILDWLARNRVAGKRGSTPVGARTIFERLGFDGLEESSSRSSPSPSSRRASRQSGTQAKRPSQAANFSD